MPYFYILHKLRKITYTNEKHRPVSALKDCYLLFPAVMVNCTLC